MDNIVQTEMFSVDGELWKCPVTRQCPVANCSIVEHQRRRRLGHQQLRTATGEHPAGVTVKTADVVLTACRTNVACLQPGMMEPCRSASERRLSAHARALPTSGNWRVCRWCGPNNSIIAATWV